MVGHRFRRARKTHRSIPEPQRSRFEQRRLVRGGPTRSSNRPSRTRRGTQACECCRGERRGEPLPSKDELDEIGFVICSQCGAHIKADRRRCLRCRERLVAYKEPAVPLPAWLEALGGGTL